MKAKTFLGVLCLAMGLMMDVAHAEWLILPDEARALDAPVSHGQPLLKPMSLSSNGPRITVHKPELLNQVRPPVDILVSFAPGDSGAKPDLSSLRVHLLKFINIDITDRLKKFLKADRLDVIGAEVPAGNHRLRVTVADTAGQESQREFRLVIREE